MKIKKKAVHVERGDYWIRVSVDGTLIHEHHTLESDRGLQTLVEALGATYTESEMPEEAEE